MVKLARRKRAPMTPEIRRLAEDYLPWGKKVIASLIRKRPCFRDLQRRDGDRYFSVMQAALVAAARDFDPENGIAFATFARFRIVGEIGKSAKHHLRSLILFKRGGLARDARRWWVFNGEGEGLSRVAPGFRFQDSEPAVVDRDDDAPDEVEAILRQIPPKAATALRAVYLEGLTHIQAGTKLGWAPSEVSRQVQLARKLLSR